MTFHNIEQNCVVIAQLTASLLYVLHNPSSMHKSIVLNEFDYYEQLSHLNEFSRKYRKAVEWELKEKNLAIFLYFHFIFFSKATYIRGFYSAVLSLIGG